LWVAESHERKQLCELQIKLDEIEFLKAYSESTKHKIKSTEAIAPKLPNVDEKLGELANALEASQNFLGVVGIKDGNVEDQASETRKILHEQKSTIEDIGTDLQNAKEITETAVDCIRKLEKDLNETVKIRESCTHHLNLFNDEMTRKASLNIGLESVDSSQDRKVVLEIPPEVPEPRLIDI
jgi:archaellum component FlaC